ncbi:hypothetical protein MYG64_22515 (plasmid) [Ensifer adhaerens]|uniref:hypothetical protein n=1 Tax=Ensifer adhaerens TaxID=106592 RepID=UPI00210134FB|nr:hypothetical protein [Ensifer adhaerens]UTV40336.1 hypothetical protein MYG64_22515 [Ensifer adhaerens]
MTPDRSAQPPSQPIADLQIAIAAFVAGAGWLFSIHALAEFPPLLFLGRRRGSIDARGQSERL